ncbi:ABC transporter substrate-binding protein [Cohnella sp. REN36]|uniref:ABC transporter substrate-binding protein n=1 Tax=Cohnella sp. REN36 TaxID=2887347 RepID=UPI001D15179D|nr:extracellular solute-binding protein [Cohnella sp. REN36]MCC3372904.1 extracellular solute-binding protein [Cohnella sp. REN36]
MTPNNKKIRRIAAGGMALTMLVPLLAACNSGDDKNDPKNRHTLRIGTMYGSSQDEYWFRQQYTDLFEFSHSNIDIEIVPAIDYTETQFEEPEKQQQPVDQLAKVKAIMTGANPVDVMIIDQPSLLTQLVQENLVKPLDPMIKEDKIDTTAFVPTVIDGIKELGGDEQLYALTPTFMPSALFYNKTLFQKAGVELPTDGMSWDDVFNMAKRLASGKGGKDGTYGFTFNQWGGSDPYSDVQSYVAPLKMRLYDEKAEKMTVNTPQWANAWTKIADLYKNHVVPNQEDMQAIYSSQQPYDGKQIYNPYQNQLFYMGKSAMMIGQYSLLNELETFGKNYEKLKMQKLDWDVVTVPQFTNEAPGIGININLSTLSAINAKAANPDDAWEFIKFMSGEEWAKFKSRSSYEMPSRKDFIKVRDGMSYNLDAFTKLKPVPQLSMSDLKLQQERTNLSYIDQLGRTEFNKVMQGQMTVQEALKEFEEKGNDLLQKIKLNPKGPMEGVGGDVYGGGVGGGAVIYK